MFYKSGWGFLSWIHAEGVGEIRLPDPHRGIWEERSGGTRILHLSLPRDGGVRHATLVDPQLVNDLNRQILHWDRDVERSKVGPARKAKETKLAC